MGHLKILLGTRNLSLQKWLYHRRGPVCQQPCTGLKDTSCSIDKCELCTVKQAFISDLFQRNRFWNLKG